MKVAAPARRVACRHDFEVPFARLDLEACRS
jgi:hypothetical protein